MPPKAVTQSIAPRTFSELIANLQTWNPETAAREYPWADRFVLGLPLVPWQRPFKWSAQQCERFVASAWSGVHLGSYIVTPLEFERKGLDFQGVEYTRLSNAVIDGQQRLTALEMYFTDRIALPDIDGKLALWSDVDTVDQRRFARTIFGRGELQTLVEEKLRSYYDLLNFGGTTHLESERATVADVEDDNIIPAFHNS